MVAIAVFRSRISGFYRRIGFFRLRLAREFLIKRGFCQGRIGSPRGSYLAIGKFDFSLVILLFIDTVFRPVCAIACLGRCESDR